MKHPPPKKPIPLAILSVCCPEAQADGVPCTSIGRACEDCQRASARADDPRPDGDMDEVRDDSWAV